MVKWEKCWVKVAVVGRGVVCVWTDFCVLCVVVALCTFCRYEYWRAMFPVVTTEQIAEFSTQYKGSDEEKQDVLRGMTRSEEHTSELQSLMRITYAVFCLKKK